MTLQEMKETAEQLIKDIDTYTGTGTKASSKRIRTGLGTIKRETARLRKDLVTADKNGKVLS